jgi:hypothetical protein
VLPDHVRISDALRNGSVVLASGGTAAPVFPVTSTSTLSSEFQRQGKTKRRRKEKLDSPAFPLDPKAISMQGKTGCLQHRK